MIKFKNRNLTNLIVQCKSSYGLNDLFLGAVFFVEQVGLFFLLSRFLLFGRCQATAVTRVLW